MLVHITIHERKSLCLMIHDEKTFFEANKEGLLSLIESVQSHGGQYTFSSDFNHPDEFPDIDRRILDIIAGNYNYEEQESE